MKTIALIPTKNEEWIIGCTLKNLSSFCDHIIVADQMSTDKTREICRQFDKVKLIDNNFTDGHSNKVRWKLLDAARNFDGNNLIICIDADEVIPADLIIKKLPDLQNPSLAGSWLEMRWVQLWKDIHYYRDDNSVWSNIWKPLGWIDNRKLGYPKKVVVNDHTFRVPGRVPNPTIRLEGVPVLHLQWVPWEKAQIKQAWYRCAELIKSPKSYYDINKRYENGLEDGNEKLSQVPKEWLQNINFPKDITHTRPGWQYDQIKSWFDQYGIEFFEPLQIWHVNSLNKEFKERVKREPVSNTTPPFGYKTRKKIRHNFNQVEHKIVMSAKKIIGR